MAARSSNARIGFPEGLPTRFTVEPPLGQDEGNVSPRQKLGVRYLNFTRSHHARLPS